MAISGNTAIVGAHGDDDDGSASGSAYIFSRNGSSWTEQAKLTASDAAADDRFAFSVDIFGDTAIAGAHMHDDHGSKSGSAYVYQPVPEPSGLVMLLGLGGACLLWYGLRRRSRVARP